MTAEQKRELLIHALAAELERHLEAYERAEKREPVTLLLSKWRPVASDIKTFIPAK